MPPKKEALFFLDVNFFHISAGCAGGFRIQIPSLAARGFGVHATKMVTTDLIRPTLGSCHA